MNNEAKRVLRKAIKTVCQRIARDRKEENYYWDLCEGKTSREAQRYEIAAEEYHAYVCAERGILKDLVKMYLEEA